MKSYGISEGGGREFRQERTSRVGFTEEVTSEQNFEK